MAAAIALTAIPSARRAYQALTERHASVDLLDLAAVGISLGTGQPLTAAFITWLLGVGDIILAQTTDRARAAISKLMELDAEDAWRVTDSGETERVPVKRLAVGDRIVVEAGGRVAADGIVERGVALVDEKALTGESVPVERKAGERVLAASVVVEGQLVVTVDRAGTDTTAAKIVQILEGAGAKPMTLQRETERIADKLVLPTFGVAGAAALLTSQIDRMTCVLITDFGTGIRIAVPTAALAAMTAAAREGVLVKGGQFLERMSKVDAIVFDKTGTLTGGAPVGVRGGDHRRHVAGQGHRPRRRRRGTPGAPGRRGHPPPRGGHGARRARGRARQRELHHRRRALCARPRPHRAGGQPAADAPRRRRGARRGGAGHRAAPAAPGRRRSASPSTAASSPSSATPTSPARRAARWSPPSAPAAVAR